RKTGTSESAEGLGDCIDCQMCVQVCPTGIDIRDGLQMECIGCAACIDACDSIMEKIGAPTGLVRYTSERELSGGKLRVLRPRLLGYGGLLAVFIGVLVWAIASRPLVDLDVTRDRGLYRFNAAGEIENSYTLKVLNKAQHPRLFDVWVSGVEGLRLLGGTRISAGAGERVEVPVSVSVPAAAMMDPITDIKFHLQAADSDAESAEDITRFIGAAR
ncbi:MAG: 4Fe-4S dicluster domain-containing protein, partial [Pseudomonadota bacterium]|nr:4Fe-4S dicluster domain-containing protein [Pseudomonadota bacterium]